MSECKYTNDGRKVRVVGKLNAEQTIVQEIFVSGDQEIPSGENFVVPSLHDQPVESWKEKRIREIDERYEKRMNEGRKELKRWQRQNQQAIEKLKAQTSAWNHLARNAHEGQLRRLFDFLTGNITHFFIAKSYEPAIIDWDSDQLYQRWDHRIEGMKLISLLGNSKGDLTYRLHEYSDGSGGLGCEIIPCQSYNDALQVAQSYLDAEQSGYLEGDRRGISLDRWEKIEGIEIWPEVRDKWNQEKKEAREKRISELHAEIEKIQNQEE